MTTVAKTTCNTDPEIGLGNNRIRPRPLSYEVDYEWVRQNFKTEIDRFENGTVKDSNKDSGRAYVRYVCWCLWILSKNRRAVSIDKIAAKDLEHLKIELELRHQANSGRILRVFSAFVSYITDRPPLVDPGRFGEKKRKGIVGKNGTFATHEQIKSVEKSHSEILSRFAESEQTSGLAAATTLNHRRCVCACIGVLDSRGITVPDSVSQADIDLLKKDLKEKGISTGRVLRPFLQFLSFCGNPCGDPTITHHGCKGDDWKLPFLDGFRFTNELDQYRDYLRNRGIDECYVEVKISRVKVCGRILDSLYGEKPLKEINTYQTEGLESFIKEKTTGNMTVLFLSSYFEFLGYFGIRNYYADLIQNRKTHIVYHPKSNAENEFLVKLQE